MQSLLMFLLHIENHHVKLLWNALHLRSSKAVLRSTGVLLRGFQTYLVWVNYLSWRHRHWIILTSNWLRLVEFNLSFRTFVIVFLILVSKAIIICKIGTFSKGWKDPNPSVLVQNIKVIVFIVLVVQVLNKSTGIQSLRAIIIIQIMIDIMSVFWRAYY